MLSAIVVTNASDLVNGDTSSAAALQADPGSDGISLREAVEAANRTNNEQIIRFDRSLAGQTITLSGSQLELTGDTTIVGLGAEELTIDANGRSRVFAIGRFDEVEIYGLTVRGGNGRRIDGGVFQGDGLGGAIINAGTLTVRDSTITASGAGHGGGLYNDAGGTLTVQGSRITGNSAGVFGGGIANGNNSLSTTVFRSVITDNTAFGSGGGIWNEGGATDSQGIVIVRESVLSDNAAETGGGLSNAGGTVIVRESTLSGNAADSDAPSADGGGAIYNNGHRASSAKDVLVINSTLVGNSTTRSGGGIYNSDGDIAVINSTLAGNAADVDGGGIYNTTRSSSGMLTVTNSTLVANTADADDDGVGIGAGIRKTNEFVSDTTVNNSIIAGNVNGVGTTTDDISGFPISSSHNFIGEDSATGGEELIALASLFVDVNGDSRIDADDLANYGGFTETIALREHVSVVDAGDDTLAVDADGNPLTTDQRSSRVPRLSAPTVDLGAFERHPSDPDNQFPVISSEAVTLGEKSPLGTAVTTVQAHDPDSEGDLLFSIEGGNGTGSGAFAIDQHTGVISVADPAQLDFETTNGFQLRIEVSDSGGRTSAATVHVTLNRVNDPPALENQTVSVDENSVSGTVIGTVQASDPDAGDSLSYTITDGNDAGAFVLDSSTGEISVADASQLDFESTSTYSLTVQVADAGGLTDTGIVSVIVNDVNEEPSINSQSYAVNENSVSGTVIGTVQASDPDAGDLLAFSIAAGNSSGAFALDASTGQLTVADASRFDFETTASYVLTVQVVDTGGLTDEATVTVNLNDVNEQPVIGDQSFAVDENSPASTVVGMVQASDPDAGDLLNFTITGGNDSGAFAVNEVTGQIMVDTPGALDFETSSSFLLMVEVSDSGGLTDSAMVTVTVNDRNEAPVLDVQSFATPPDSPRGTVTGTLTANDPDSGDSVTYAITGGNGSGSGVFAVEPSSGLITVADAEQLAATQAPGLTLTITVTDSKGLSSSGTVPISFESLRVTNVSDEVNGDTTSVQALMDSPGSDGISLREAVLAANTTSGPVSITFDSGLSGQTITLGGTQLELTDDVTITGRGVEGLQIDAFGLSRVLQVDPGVHATLAELEIAGGMVAATSSGGGLLNAGTLTIVSSRVVDNEAGSGGAVGNTGRLMVTNSEISDNTATSQPGGGIRNDSGGSVTVIDSTITENSRGGLFNADGGLAVVEDTTISWNSVNGGIANEGLLTVTDSALLDNDTFGDGGAVSNTGTAILTGSTVTGNTARNSGGGVYNAGSLTVVSSTVVSNQADRDGNGSGQGGGIAQESRVGSETTLNNTVVAGNVSGSGRLDDDIQDSDGRLNGAHNLVGDPATSGTLSNNTDGNIVGQDDSAGGREPLNLLAVFVDVSGDGLIDSADARFNGGTTGTLALAAGSPAADAGDDSLAVDAAGSALTTDQRGRPFVRVAGAAIDIGAYERQTLDPSFFIVTTSADEFVFGDANVSLREAISAASGSAGDETITFAAGLSGQTIVLDGKPLNLSGNVAIVGPGAEQLTIDADGRSGVFEIAPGTTAELSGLKITGAGSGSAAVSNDGVLTVMNATVSGNSNGGITDFNTNGSLTVLHSTITGNAATSVGGGIYTLGSLTVTDSTISDNTAGFFGGGIYSGGTATIISSTISGNTADFEGFGEGGGVYSFGGLTMINSTISGNTAARSGGGIQVNDGTLNLTHVTLVGNRANLNAESGGTGGGLARSASATGEARVNNTIIAGNIAGASGGAGDIDDPGQQITGSHNLIGDPSTAGSFVNGSGGNIVGQDDGSSGRELLDLTTVFVDVNSDGVVDANDLSDNGGSTPTLALVAGSPAIDSAEDVLALDADGSPLINDQRGDGFSRSVGLAVDIGAVERQSEVTFPQPVSVSLPAGGGTYEVLYDGGELVVRGGSGSELLREPVSDIASLTIRGSGEADLVTVLAAGSGVDTPLVFDGGDGNDVFDGSLATGPVVLTGNSGDDVLIGGPAGDTLNGGAGSDELVGNGGADLMRGHGSTGDTLDGGDGNDTLDGGRGNDLIRESFAGNATLTNGAMTGRGSDTVISTERALLTGGPAAQMIDVSAFFTAGQTSVTLNGGGGDDSLVGSNGNDVLVGAGGSDVMDGGSGSDRMFGGSGADTLIGGDGDDFLKGLGGSGDNLKGGSGDDTLNGGRGIDRVIESGDADFTLTNSSLIGAGNDFLLALEVAEINAGNSDSLIDVSAFRGFRGFVMVRAGGGNDTVIGSAGPDVLNGGDGNDSLVGNGGPDILNGDAGSDVLQGKEGSDTLNGGDGNDGLSGFTGNDVLNGERGYDRIFGGDGNDTLTGGNARDTLFGGAGDDFLAGDGGADTLVGGTGDNNASPGDSFNDGTAIIDEAFSLAPLPEWVDQA